jgi:hypothetical protein
VVEHSLRRLGTDHIHHVDHVAVRRIRHSVQFRGDLLAQSSEAGRSAAPASRDAALDGVDLDESSRCVLEGGRRAAFFFSFGLNQWLQYRGIGRWADYAYGEKTYLVLSLVAKSVLAWQIFAGSLAG